MTWYTTGARGSAAGWRTALRAERSRIPYVVLSLEFVMDINKPAGRTSALGSTQPLTEMSTTNI